MCAAPGSASPSGPRDARSSCGAAASAGTLSRIPAGDEDARALVLGSMAAIAAFLVAGLFEYNFGDTEVLLVALALMALPFIVQRDLDAAAASVRCVDGA